MVKVGDVLEIEGRLYDVVPYKHGGATLEPAITTSVAEILAAHGRRFTRSPPGGAWSSSAGRSMSGSRPISKEKAQGAGQLPERAPEPEAGPNAL